MKPRSSVLEVVVGLLVANMFLVGCGGGGDDSDTSDATEASATGTWGFVDPAGKQETMALTDSGGTISGTTTRGATVTGTRTKKDAHINLHYANNYTITVVVVINGNSMTGTVTDSNGGNGTVTIVKIVDGGNATPGLYVGTENVTVSMSGINTSIGSVTFMLQVDASGQVMLPTADMITSAGGMSAHTMISHTQNGNNFTLTTTVDMAGYGTLSFTYNGTVSGNTISGTISGSGPMGLTIGGTFNLTKQ